MTTHRLALSFLLLAGPAGAATVDVTVAGVSAAGGTVFASLCDKDSFLKRCALRQPQKAQAGQMLFHFDNVAPGRYAVAVHHDADENGKLDRNMLGIPKEGYGFSRDPRTQMGPPSFDDAAIEVGGDAQAVAVTMKY